MKYSFSLLYILFAVFIGCSVDDDANRNAGDNTQDVTSAEFTVTIENVVTPQPIFQSGVFNTPIGATSPAPLLPGDAYEFEIDAGPIIVPNGDVTRLSFVTMFVQSNDLFLAPDENGIALYDTDGNAIGANGPEDVTSQVLLWDAGTEVNGPTGGPNQKPQQDPMAEDIGEDENGVVTQITDNVDAAGNQLPDNDEVIQVTIENIADAQFLVRIENVSNNTTIALQDGSGETAPVPLSPGTYAIHTGAAPFFVEGEAAANAGLVASTNGVENIAEDGFPMALTMDTAEDTGLLLPFSPGAWAVHEEGSQPLYQINTPDFGEGLEGVAEDGTPMTLTQSLNARAAVSVANLFNTPVGATSPGPATPGNSYQFSFTAEDGQNLSFATMFIQSNDWFYAFRPDGLELFDNGQPVTGDVTEQVFLYDAGTEINEYPGAGLFQVIRQPELNSGAADANINVRLVSSDAENVPSTAASIRVTVTAN